MCGLVRMYCWRNGVTWIEDYPIDQGKTEHRRLIAEGVTVYHTEVV